MKIFKVTKKLVKVEKQYTAKILNNLMIIERDKLYSELKYSSLHKYVVKELGYSDAEASMRVNAARLMLKSKKAKNKIDSGKLNLTNAAQTNKAIKGIKNSKVIDELVEEATKNSTRGLKEIIAKKFEKKRSELLNLDEHMIEKFDKLRKVYGDLSTYELIQILLEKELKAPIATRSVRHKIRQSRFIPKRVKVEVYTGKCAQCGVRHGLEYDHITKYSHGGDNSFENIQLLCRSCNQRKEIKEKQMNIFA